MYLLVTMPNQELLVDLEGVASDANTHTNPNPPKTKFFLILWVLLETLANLNLRVGTAYKEFLKIELNSALLSFFNRM